MTGASTDSERDRSIITTKKPYCFINNMAI